MNGKGIGLAVAFAVTVAATPAMAHHSFAAEFEANRPVKLKGTVTKIEWMNPHAYFYIEVKDEPGKVTSWGLEMGSPNGLMRQGWTRNSMKIGDEIVVEGSQAKDGSDIANARSVVLGNGERLFAASDQDSQRQ
jgi:hypothetical protein